MRRLCPSFVAAALLILGPGPASADDGSGAPLLFNVFKTFCIDTGAKAEAVAAAVQTAGGKAGAPVSLSEPEPATAASWDVEMLGRSWQVASGTIHSASDAGRGLYTVTCAVMGAAGDDASMAAAASWVGVHASYSVPGALRVDLFDFQFDGAGPLALPRAEIAFRSLQRQGRVWTLGLERSAGADSMQLLHTVPLGTAP